MRSWKVHDGAKNNCSRINCKMAVSNFGRTLSNAVSLSSNAIFHFVSKKSMNEDTYSPRWNIYACFYDRVETFRPREREGNEKLWRGFLRIRSRLRADTSEDTRGKYKDVSNGWSLHEPIRVKLDLSRSPPSSRRPLIER